MPSTREISSLLSSKIWSLTQFLVQYTASKKVAASLLLLLNLEILTIIQGTKTYCTKNFLALSFSSLSFSPVAFAKTFLIMISGIMCSSSALTK